MASETLAHRLRMHISQLEEDPAIAIDIGLFDEAGNKILGQLAHIP